MTSVTAREEAHERESIDLARSTARKRAKADEPTQERAPTVEAERAERQSRDRREDHTRATNSCYVIEAVQSDRVKANEEVTQERAADEWREPAIAGNYVREVTQLISLPPPRTKSNLRKPGRRRPTEACNIYFLNSLSFFWGGLLFRRISYDVHSEDYTVLEALTILCVR